MSKRKNDNLEIEKVLKGMNLHTSKDSCRLSLCGIYYDVDNDCIVSTDGDTMIKFHHKDLATELKNYLGDNFNPEQSTIIFFNKKIVNELKNKHSRTPLHYCCNNTIILIKDFDVVRFPKYDLTIPQNDKLESLEKYYPSMSVTTMIKFAKTFKLMDIKTSVYDNTIIFDYWGNYKQPAVKYNTYKESSHSQILFLAMPLRIYRREIADSVE